MNLEKQIPTLARFWKSLGLSHRLITWFSWKSNRFTIPLFIFLLLFVFAGLQRFCYEWIPLPNREWYWKCVIARPFTNIIHAEAIEGGFFISLDKDDQIFLSIFFFSALFIITIILSLLLDLIIARIATRIHFTRASLSSLLHIWKYTYITWITFLLGLNILTPRHIFMWVEWYVFPIILLPIYWSVSKEIFLRKHSQQPPFMIRRFIVLTLLAFFLAIIFLWVGWAVFIHAQI